MELQQFIEETLVQIAHGIDGANERLAESSAAVNPRNVITYLKEVTRLHGYLDESGKKFRRGSRIGHCR